MKAKLTKPARVVIGVSAAAYLAALPTPALLFRTHPPVKGITTLIWGWWGIATGDVSWFANPVYFLALGALLLGFHKSGQLLSVLALLLGFRSVYVREWFFNEAGGNPVAALGLAFYLWMASFAILLVGAFGLQWCSWHGRDKSPPVIP